MKFIVDHQLPRALALHLASRSCDGPQLVWVRIGNCRKPQLMAAFDRVWPDLIAELKRGARVVEVR